MTSVFRGLTFTVAATAISLTAACGGGGGFDDSPEGMAAAERHETMEQIAEHNIVIREMAMGEREVDEAVFVESAVTLAALSETVLDGFEVEGIAEGSRATPEIWENWSDFQSKANDLINATAAVASAAESGGFDAAQGLVSDITPTCGGCHRPYRAPEE